MARTRNMAEFFHATEAYIKWRNAYHTAPSYGQIYRAHSAECDTPVSERGMREGNWMQDMEVIYGKRDEHLDVPFELNRIGEYRIGPEEVEDVVYIWALVKEISSTSNRFWAEDLNVPDGHPLSPTVRMVEWWARVMRMCPSLKLKVGAERIKRHLFGSEPHVEVPCKWFAALDVYYVAGAYVTRELQKTMLSLPVTFDDLNGCLAYAPWADWDGDGIEEHDSPQARYTQALFHYGSIPPLKVFNPRHTPALIELFKMKDWFPKEVESEAARESVPMNMLQATQWPIEVESPAIPVWVLPSQWLSYQ